MKVVGLTGGIASGKSTVARILASRSIPVVDADSLSREAMAPGQPAYQDIIHRWPEVVSPSGSIDRVRLGTIVFSDHQQLRELTDLVLPRLAQLYKLRKQEWERQNFRLGVFEAATLLEENLESLVDGVLLVGASEQNQIHRLAARNKYSEQEARARMAAQLSWEEKLTRANWLLDNSGDLSSLEQKVWEVWEQICKDLLKSD